LENDVKAAALVAFSIIATSRLVEAGSPAVRVVRESVPLSVARAGDLVVLLTKLVEASSVNSTSYIRPEDRWAESTSAPSLIQVRFPHGRMLRVMDRENTGRHRTLVSEILLVVPRDAWPDHILLKLPSGVVAVTKYAPCDLVHLMRESDLVTLDSEKKRYGMTMLCGHESER
jgi:hypothetical protein